MVKRAAVCAEEVGCAVGHVVLLVSNVDRAIHITQEPDEPRRGQKRDVVFVLAEFCLFPASIMFNVD